MPAASHTEFRGPGLACSPRTAQRLRAGHRWTCPDRGLLRPSSHPPLAGGAGWGKGAGAGLPPRTCTPGLACLACLLSATCFMLQSRSYCLEIFNSYAASLNLIVFAFFEVVRVIYTYSLRQ